MRRKPLVVMPLLASFLLLIASSPTLAAPPACTAGNPVANLVQTTPPSDLTDNGDGTVTHAKTGLMWKQCAEGQSGTGCATGSAAGMNWSGALMAANAANTGTGFAHHADWRLPNRKELRSIVESCGYNPSINQAAFPATPASGFWSASSYVPGAASAWAIDFGDGASHTFPKSSTFFVRLVRGGNSVDAFDSLAGLHGVTYNGNGNDGGSAPVDGNAYALGAAVTVLDNTGGLAKTGYAFTGWNSNASGTGASFAGGATFAMASSDVVLFAQWTTVATVPDAPTIGTATAGNAQASVAFTAPANTGGGAITSYTASCGPQSASGPASPITVFGLTNGASYTCTVTATNATGTGAASAPSNAVTPATVPDAPNIGTATPGNTQISVAFTAPTNDGGSAISGYSATCGGNTVNGLGSPIAVTGLINGNSYTCVVTATNAIGTGPASNPSNSVTPTPGTTSITVSSLVRAMPSPTMADSVTYTLTFGSSVSGVTASNLAIVPIGITAASVKSVTGTGTTWTITINTGRGTGTLRLDVANVVGIVDGASTPLAATTFTGETYQIDKGGTVIGVGQGHPDGAFGSGGYALFSLVRGVASPGAIAVLSGGKILAAGGVACDPDTDLNCTLQLAQYSAAGVPDTTFAPNGQRTTAISAINPDLSALIVNGNGTFFVSGNQASGAINVPFVAKFASNGTAAAGFGSSGVAQLATLPLGYGVTGAAVDGSGRVLVVGTKPGVVPQGNDIFVARLTAAGALDATFGSGGIASFGISSSSSRNDLATDVTVQPNGRIVVGGRTLGATGFYNFLLLRLTSAGALDTTFGTAGVASTRFAASTGDNAGRKLALQPDGKIVLVGSVQVAGMAQCGVARFNADGTLDAGFGSGGQTLIPLTQGCLAVTLQSGGELVVAALDLDKDLSYATFARLLANGDPDTSFGTGGILDISSYGYGTRVAQTSTGALVTGLVREDPTDGLLKSYVVQLGSIPLLAQTITFAALTNKTMLQSSVMVSSTASSGLAVTFTTITPAVCAAGGVNGAQITLLAAGTCTVMADQAGNGTYAAASTVQRSFTVTQVNQTITFGGLANKTLAQSPVTVSATASSTLAVTFTTATPLVCATGGVNGTTITLLAVGTCTVRADQAGNTVYSAAAAVSRSFTVSKATQTIAFGSLSNRTLAQSPFTLSASASSGLAVTFTSKTTKVCKVSGATVTLLKKGTCTLQADQVGNAIYNAAPAVQQSLVVS